MIKMRYTVLIQVLLLFALIFNNEASAQGLLIFESVTTIENGAEPFVSGGTLISDADNYAEVLFSKSPLCMAVVISEYHILTARHCFRGVSQVAILNLGPGVNQQRISNCVLHGIADVAICKFPNAISAKNAMFVSEPVKVKTQVKLVGIGCNNSNDDYGFREGTTSVLTPPKKRSLTYTLGPQAANPFEQAVVLCFGDSGGPTFVASDGVVNGLIGINSLCIKNRQQVNCKGTGLSQSVAISAILPWINEVLDEG